jgi:hypothetical protein
MKYLLALVFFVGCGTVPTTPIENKPEEVKPVLKSIKNIWPKPEFDEKARAAIHLYGEKLLAATPKDIDSWCLNWSNVDKVSFYSSLLSHMSKFESNFKPELTYTERFPDDSGNKVVSRGLLQVSYESCLKGYKVALAKGEELHGVEKNLECSVKILNRLVPEDGLISAKIDGKYKGGARYWSVLRPENKLSLIKSGVMGQCN